MSEHMETITDPAEIRATDEPDERDDFPCCTTPARVGAAVALDLDGVTARAEWAQQAIGTASTAYRTVSEDVPALVAEVRRLELNLSVTAAQRDEARHLLRLRSDALARVTREVATLRAKVAAVEAYLREHGGSGYVPTHGVHSALATTGEGQ